MSGLVIIGTGHAGLTLAREWRKRDPDTALTLVTADDGAAYYKPNLSKALASGKTADELITAAPDKVAADYAAELITGVQVTALDPAAKQITLNDGRHQAYAQLVFANGASCRHIPVQGDAADTVLHVNNRLDYQRFRQQLPDGGHVVIIGAGLIGCEYANDLVAQGYDATLVDPLAWPLGMLLPETVARSLEQALTNAGAQFRLGQTVSRVDHAGAQYQVTLDDGATISADLVLSAVGLVPNTAVAKEAGLATGRGIKVNPRMETSAADVYALGDVAEVGGHVLPYVLPITNCARALAATLAGEPTAVQWPAMPVMVKTPVLPTVVCPPPARAAGEWQMEGGAPDWVARFVGGDGTLLGFALTGAATRERGRLAGETRPPQFAD
ncbi:MAG: FAD-dependent oxidoreductase [Oceanococcaceae bacterium]